MKITPTFVKVVLSTLPVIVGITFSGDYFYLLAKKWSIVPAQIHTLLRIEQ